jgi:hypothetical protein
MGNLFVASAVLGFKGARKAPVLVVESVNAPPHPSGFLKPLPLAMLAPVINHTWRCSNSGASHLRSPHPRPPVPLPDEPCVAPLADIRPCLPRAVDRLLLPADVAPAEVDLCPFERPVVKDPRERLRLRSLCLLQAVIAEVLSPVPSHRRCRSLAADVAGLVLYRRDGDVVSGVDGDSSGSTLTATAANECSRIRAWNCILNMMYRIHRFIGSSVENRTWVFQTKENKLFIFSDVKIRRHSCPKLNANPYLDRKYFLERQERMKRQTPGIQTGLSFFV